MTRILIDTDELRSLASDYESAESSLGHLQRSLATSLAGTSLNQDDPAIRGAQIHQRQGRLDGEVLDAARGYGSEAGRFRSIAAAAEASQGHGGEWVIPGMPVWPGGLSIGGAAAAAIIAAIARMRGGAVPGAGAAALLAELRIGAHAGSSGLLGLVGAASGVAGAVDRFGDRLRLLAESAWEGIWSGITDSLSRVLTGLGGVLRGIVSVGRSIAGLPGRLVSMFHPIPEFPPTFWILLPIWPWFPIPLPWFLRPPEWTPPVDPGWHRGPIAPGDPAPPTQPGASGGQWPEGAASPAGGLPGPKAPYPYGPAFPKDPNGTSFNMGPDRPCARNGLPATGATCDLDDGRGYFARQCTSWVAFRRADLGRAVPPGMGNAAAWVDTAWYRENRIDQPQAGAVAISTAGGYGHVMIVESVNADGTITISEMNKDAQGSFGFRTISPAGLHFAR